MRIAIIVVIATLVWQCAPPPASDNGAVNQAALSTATGTLPVELTPADLFPLPDGRQIAVGLNMSGWVRAAIYDPTTGSWVSTSNPPALRSYRPVYGQLADGRLIVAGGATSPSVPVATVELYSATTDTWTAAAPMGTARNGARGVRLADGRFLVAGGSAATGEIYDPGTDSWTPTTGSTSAGFLVLLADGRVFATSGVFPYLYDPATNAWTSPPGYATSGTSSGTRLPDGRVLLTGSAQPQLWNPSTQMFIPAGTPLYGRTQFRAQLLSSGAVIVLGGVSSSSVQLDSIERLNPFTAQWFSQSPLLQVRRDFGTSLLPDGTTLVAGGYRVSSGYTQFTNVAEKVSPDSCSPSTCAALGKSCGPTDDGCGGVLECGACGAGQTCLGNVCASTTDQTAQYDASRLAPACAAIGRSCDSAALLNGKGAAGPEPHAPNTIGGSCADGAFGAYHAASFGESCDRLKISTVDGTLLAPGKTVRIDATVWTSYPASDDHLDLYFAVNAAAPAWTLITTITPTASGQNVLSATYTLPTGAVQAIRATYRLGGSPGACTTGAYDDHDDLVFAVAPTDGQAPSVSVSAPADGAIVRGVVTLQATATDNAGVLGVTFYDGTSAVGTSTAAPFSAAWNTAGLPDGPRTLTARAHDGAGNHAISSPTTVVIDGTAPATTLTSPAEGAVIGVSASWSATASDANPIAQVELVVDGVSVATDLSSPWGGTWNAAAAADGSHALQSRCTDAAGNVALSAPVGVEVDHLPPTAALTAPEAGAMLRGTVAWSATADDAHGVANVELLVDGAPVASDPSAPYDGSWNSTTVADGAHELRARATDVPGNAAASAPLSVTVDNHGPTVSVSAPGEGETVHGAVTVVATASDTVGVARVDVYDGASLIGAATSPPYAVTWGATYAGEGAHQLTAVAWDAAGNGTPSAPRSVTVSNAPSTQVTSPGEGSTVSGSVSLLADATALDGRSIIRVDFLVDGAVVDSDTTSPFAVDWSSRSVPNGAHVLTSRATDSASFTATSTPVSITTDNDFTPPAVAVTAPAAGALLRGTVTLTADASDASGVARVDFYVDGVLAATASSAPWQASWNCASVGDGGHAVLAVATDAAGNAAESPLITFSVDNSAPATAITAPADGSNVGQQVITVSATASDNVAIARVDFFDGASLIGSDSSVPYAVSWNTAGLSGNHALTAVAFDTAGGSATSAAVTVTVRTPQTAVYDAALKAPKCGTLGVSCDSGSLLTGRGTVGPELNQPNTINASCADGNSGTFHASESLDRLSVAAAGGAPLAPGVVVTVSATVWATNANDRLDIFRAPNANSPSWTLVATLTPTVFNASSVLQTSFTLPAGALQAVRGSFRRNGSAAACPSGGNNDRDDLIVATQ